MKKERVQSANVSPQVRVGQAHSTKQKVDPDPPHGEKGNFRKITVTLPPAAFEKLVNESARRKIAGERNHLLSALVREAVVEYLREREKG